jgi:hypothetical protein
MEVWKDIVKYEGIYQISNLRNVKSMSFQKSGKEKLMKMTKGQAGYLKIILRLNSIKHTYSIHRLVAIAFIDNLEEKPQVNHKNGIKTDNRVENLEWNTSKENINHSYNTGLKKGYKLGQKGITNPSSKLNEKDVLEIRNSTLRGAELARKYNVSSTLIYSVLKNKIWIHI